MADVYLGFLIGGCLFALLSLLFSTVGGHHSDFSHPAPDHAHSGHGLHLDFLKPVVIVSAIAGFGGAGLMLDRLAALAPLLEAGIAALSGCMLGGGVWALAVRPMRNVEQTGGYAMAELEGKIAEVVTTIPEEGYGEIIVRVGAGFTSRPATSIDDQRIASGTRVVIVEVEDGVVRVVPFE